MIYPAKITNGSCVRIIAPSASLMIPQDWNTDELRNNSEMFLKDMGLNITYGKYASECDEFLSTSIEHRTRDLHDAFADPSVTIIICAIGGFNANQLLKFIDYELIKANPKIFCGYSDITVLGNAIYHKTGLITYSGPHFTTWGNTIFREYTHDYFKKCLKDNGPYEVSSSRQWHDFTNLYNNDGYWIINEGSAEGIIIGGNLSTFNQLQGTEFMPDLKDSILFIEDDSLVDSRIFDRDLVSLIQQPGFENIRGIVIGRFQPESKVTKGLLERLIKTKMELNHIPVIANADFGHTKPLFTFPIGGKAILNSESSDPMLKILEH